MGAEFCVDVEEGAHVQAATDHPAARSLASRAAGGSGHSRAGEPRRSQPRGAAVHGRTDAAGLVPPEPRRAARGQGVAARRPPRRATGRDHALRRVPSRLAGLRDRLDLARPGPARQRPEPHDQVPDAQACLRQPAHGPRAAQHGGEQPARPGRHRQARRAARGRAAQPPAAGRRAARRHLRLQHHRPRMVKAALEASFTG